MPGTYFALKNVPALDTVGTYPTDVTADDGRGGTAAEKNERVRKRKLDHLNRSGSVNFPVDVRVSPDKAQAILEMETAAHIPAGLILAGPMNAAQTRTYLLSDLAWK